MILTPSVRRQDEQQSNGVLYGAETIMGGPKRNVPLWRIQPRAASQAEMRSEAATVNTTVAELRKKVLMVAARTGNEQLAEAAKVAGSYNHGSVKLQSVAQVIESFSDILDSAPSLLDMASACSSKLRELQAPLIAAVGGAVPAAPPQLRAPPRLASLPAFSPALQPPAGQLSTKDVLQTLFNDVVDAALLFLLAQHNSPIGQLAFLEVEHGAVIDVVGRMFEAAKTRLRETVAANRTITRRSTTYSDANLRRGVLRLIQVHPRHSFPSITPHHARQTLGRPSADGRPSAHLCMLHCLRSMSSTSVRSSEARPRHWTTTYTWPKNSVPTRPSFGC